MSWKSLDPVLIAQIIVNNYDLYSFLFPVLITQKLISIRIGFKVLFDTLAAQPTFEIHRFLQSFPISWNDHPVQSFRYQVVVNSPRKFSVYESPASATFSEQLEWSSGIKSSHTEFYLTCWPCIPQNSPHTSMPSLDRPREHLCPTVYRA